MGEKRTKSLEIVDIIHVLELQSFVKFGRMNPIEVTLDSNEIIERLATYKKYKYRSQVKNLLLSSNLENNTDAIFITCDGLWEGKDALTDSKIYNTLGVLCLSEIKN